MNEMQEKANAILREYVAGGLSRDLEELIRGWLADEGSLAEEKAAELAALWEEMVSFNVMPTPKAFKMYMHISRLLGFPEQAKTKARLWKTPRVRMIAARLAAVLLPAAVVLGVYFGIHGGRETAYFAAADRKQEIKLEDGTSVWLNAGTKLVNDRYRSARLEGEAYFELTADENSPFVVKTKNITVTALGTRFNVKADPGGGHTSVSLYEGNVNIGTRSGTYALKPGSELMFDNVTREVVIADLPDLKPDWMATRMVFDHALLPEIFEALESMFGVSFDYDSVAASRHKVTFKLRGSEGLDEAMSLLSLVSGAFVYAIDGDSVIVTVGQE